MAAVDYCIAITKKHTQCRNKKNGKLFCTLHHSKIPSVVIIENTNKRVPYINLEQYYAEANKYNQTNDSQLLQRVQSLYISSTGLEDIKSICIVCNEENPTPNTLIKCSASTLGFNHIICCGCLKGHVTSLISDGIASLECMFNNHEHCNGQYTEQDIKKAIEYHEQSTDTTNQEQLQAAAADEAESEIKVPVVDSINYTKWQEVMASSEIVKLAGVCDNYLICPLCNKWGCIFEIPPGAERLAFIIKCATCARDWCTLCKRASHGGRDCYELAFTDIEQQDPSIMNRVIDKLISDIATRALTHCCSVCGCNYVKEEGCNLMTCPKCNGMSCFICGIKLYYKGDRKYWHFTGHDKSDPDARCPLWNNRAGDGKANQGNTEFNIDSIGREFWRFISANERQPIIAKIICKRIMTMYEKDKAFHDILKNIKRLVNA